ncbi:hypothetical protein PZA11_003843 [Diplocarpon coronariae]
MLFPTPIASLLALSSVAIGTRVHHKRAQQSNTTLYAYAEGPGYPVIYSDEGLAYFGKPGEANSTHNIPITFTVEDEDRSIPWTIEPHTDTVTFNETMAMYIKPIRGTFAQIGFASLDNLPAGSTTAGFTFYGNSVAYGAGDPTIELTFWGNKTSTHGVFGLYWDAHSNNRPSTAFPVALRKIAPVFPYANEVIF